METVSPVSEVRLGWYTWSLADLEVKRTQIDSLTNSRDDNSLILQEAVERDTVRTHLICIMLIRVKLERFLEQLN